MRVLAFSDLHLDEGAQNAVLTAAKKADLVIGAGDFATQRQGLGPFMAAFGPIAEKSVFVAGNNETIDELRAATDAYVLHGDTVEAGGIIIGGVGAAVPPLPPLPWNSFDLTEAEAEELLSTIARVDILVTHSPPKGVCDQHARLGSIGSAAILAAARRLQPRFLLCGHVHDDWSARGRIGKTEVINLGPGTTWIEM